MDERDKYDEQAERLLSDWWNNHEDEPSLLFAIVAAALREAGTVNDELCLEIEYEQQRNHNNIANCEMQLADLKAEVERLKNLIGIIQRESLNDLDLISKFNAEIADLKAEVERLKKLLRYVAPSVDHFTCPSYPQCKRCEIERMLEAK